MKTIGGKLERGEYRDIYAFNKDMKLIWSNAKKFNIIGSDIYSAAEGMNSIWNRMFTTVKNDPMVSRIWQRKTRRSKSKKFPSGYGR